MSEAAPELSLEEKKAAKRKEIEEKLAGLKLQQEKEASQKTMYFGEHPGITCDACGSCPMVGYRYKCKQAPAANTLAQHPFRHFAQIFKTRIFAPNSRGPQYAESVSAPPTDVRNDRIDLSPRLYNLY